MWRLVAARKQWHEVTVIKPRSWTTLNDPTRSGTGLPVSSSLGTSREIFDQSFARITDLWSRFWARRLELPRFLLRILILLMQHRPCRFRSTNFGISFFFFLSFFLSTSRVPRSWGILFLRRREDSFYFGTLTLSERMPPYSRHHKYIINILKKSNAAIQAAKKKNSRLLLEL